MAETLNNKRRRLVIHMTGTKLKMYALITLLFYTAGICVVQNRMLGAADYDPAELAQVLAERPDLMLLSTWAALFRLIGGLGPPVFAFLLVEGFVHTSSLRRYTLTMAMFALVSEVPYDLAISGTPWNMGAQNGLFTLTICLVMLYGLRLFRGKPGTACRVFQGAIVLASALWCDLLRAESGLFLVIAVAILYQCYDRKGTRLLLVIGWTLLYVMGGMMLTGDGSGLVYLTGPLSVYALWSYDGRRGWNGNKYLFYLVYPVHFLIFYGIAHLI